MSGLTLARRLASAAPRVEIIFITAADTAAHREQAARAGCLAYFGKPFDGDEMLASDPTGHHGWRVTEAR